MAEAAFKQIARERDEVADRPLTSDAALPEILYVMGTGRSGTTILEVLLANNPGWSGVGEVKHIFRDGFLHDRPCGCGKRARQCDLWSSVLSTTHWTVPDSAHLAREIESVESHQRFPLAWVGLPEDRMKAYSTANEKLFRAVARARRCRIVVDSSKFAGRALLLSRCFPGKVRVLCITRSAASIIGAFKKQNDGEQQSKGALAVAAYYLYVILCMRLVRLQLGDRCHAIRFEDLRRDPLGTLGAIESWSGLSLSASKARIIAGDTFDVGHIVTGNRLRKAGRVRFEASRGESRGPRLPLWERLLASGLESWRKLMGF